MKTLGFGFFVSTTFLLHEFWLAVEDRAFPDGDRCQAPVARRQAPVARRCLQEAIGAIGAGDRCLAPVAT